MNKLYTKVPINQLLEFSTVVLLVEDWEFLLVVVTWPRHKELHYTR